MASQIGALANLRHKAELEAYEQQAVDQKVYKQELDEKRLAESMQPMQTPETADYERRFQENKGWLSDPKTQAALLGFAVSIMQPLGGNGGGAEFVGALGRSLGAGAAAAAGVEMAEQEQAATARADDLAERKMQVEERGLGLTSRELDIRERQLLQTGKANKFSKVISGNDALNAQLGLGIPPGMSARVTVTYDEKGNPISGSVEGEFGDGPEKLSGDAKTIVDLYDAADEAEANGRPEIAKTLRDRAKQLSQEFSLSTGEMIDWGSENAPPAGATPNAEEGNIPSSETQIVPQTGSQTAPQIGLGGSAESGGTPGVGAVAETGPLGPRVIPIPGGKVEREMEAQKAKEQSKIGDGLVKAQAVHSAVDNLRNTLATANLPPDWFITGGLGNLMSQSWFPISNNAQIVANQLDILKANVGFDALQAMRESSPTGGALGPVSDAENKLLQSTLVSLNQFQGGRDKLEESLLTLRYLFDPEAMADRQAIAKAISDGRITEAQGLATINQQMDEYIYPPELMETPVFDMNQPPDYVPPEVKELWEDIDPAQRLEFLLPDDRRKATGLMK